MKKAVQEPYKGLLAYVMQLLTYYDVDIASVKIHAIEEQVNDLLLIEKNGNFCHNVEEIIAKLTE